MITETLLALSTRLGEKLIQKQWRITCVESCTAGGIGYAITSAAGSSAWFNQGLITYSDEAKTQLANVDRGLVMTHGAVSRQVAEGMAQGGADNAKAQVAIAVTGIAGPGGGAKDKPVGLVWFGFSVNGEVTTEKQVFTGDRDAIRQQTIVHALSGAIELI